MKGRISYYVTSVRFNAGGRLYTKTVGDVLYSKFIPISELCKTWQNSVGFYVVWNNEIEVHGVQNFINMYDEIVVIFYAIIFLNFVIL